MKKLIGLLLACSASLAYAHGTPSPNHGGIVQAVGETWLELVVKGGNVALYVEDDGEPMDSAGLSGQLTIINGARKAEFALKPAGGNKLEVNGAVAAKGAKVVTLLVLADKKTRVPATFLIK